MAALSGTRGLFSSLHTLSAEAATLEHWPLLVGKHEQHSKEWAATGS